MKRVRYVGDDEVSDTQVGWGNNDDPRGVLEDGREYDVEAVDVRSWHTKITLAAHPDKRFNSVHFEVTDDGPVIPVAEDADARLEDWTYDGRRLHGRVYGHPDPRLGDGMLVRTSSVQEIDADAARARTRNTRYQLGRSAAPEGVYVAEDDS